MERKFSRLSRRYLDECGYSSGADFTQRLLANLPPDARFLDAGCGQAELKEQIPEGVEYIGVDHQSGDDNKGYAGWHHKPDLLADLHSLPLKDDHVDRAVLLHVLEHVYDPLRVLLELHRVMKPGARLFVSVPFLHELHHAPDDYFRYTRFGLTSLFHKAGFVVEEIKPSGGYFRAVAHMMGEIRKVLTDAKPLAKILLSPIIGIFLSTAWVFKRIDPILDLNDCRQEFTCGFHCVVRKPEQGP